MVLRLALGLLGLEGEGWNFGEKDVKSVWVDVLELSAMIFP